MHESERQYLQTSLSGTREQLASAVAGLTSSQWLFRQSNDTWSILDCVEHVALVENHVLKSIERVLQERPEPEKAETVSGKEKLILRATPNRGTKVEAPERVRPTGKCTDLHQVLGQFNAVRDRSIKFAAETNSPLRSHFFPHIRFGDLDCYQWLVFLSAHCARHLSQIEEIKAEPGYPRADAAAV